MTEVQDAGGAFHAVTDGLQAMLNCGQQTSFRVVFAPPAAGNYSALFRVATDDPAQPTVDVPFSCSTTTPTVETSDVAALAAAASGAARWVAAGAKTTGSGGTFWVTDMEIENTSDEDSTFRVAFLEAGHANSSAPSAAFRLAPGATLSIADVLGAGLFGKSATSGAILVAPVSPADTALIVSSRTYNLVASGTFGQFIGGVGPESRLLTGGKQLLVGLAGDDGDFRTNVGAVNTSSSSVTIRIVLRKGSDGAVIGNPVVRTIDPFGQLQVNRIFTVAAAGTTDNAFAEISLDSGSGVVAYASVIDNRSGDPICIPAAN